MIDVKTKIKAYNQTGGHCAGCGKFLVFPPKFAFRIRATRRNVKEYGEAVIYHPLNLCAWCGSKKCEESISIEHSVDAVKDLILSILTPKKAEKDLNRSL